MAALQYYDVILKPVITEKSMNMTADRKYTFYVHPDATKIQVREAVEKLFKGAKVESVNTMNIRGKKRRRGMIEGMNSEKGFQILRARVPLAELYKYSTTLSSLTSGRATFTQEFIEYQQVPADVQDKLLKAYEAEQQEED